MNLPRMLARILLRLELGPISSIDLEEYLYGDSEREWNYSSMRTHIRRLNKAIAPDGLRVESYAFGRGHGSRYRGVYHLVHLPASAMPVHKQLDPEGVWVGG